MLRERARNLGFDLLHFLASAHFSFHFSLQATSEHCSSIDSHSHLGEIQVIQSEAYRSVWLNQFLHADLYSFLYMTSRQTPLGRVHSSLSAEP